MTSTVAPGVEVDAGVLVQSLTDAPLDAGVAAAVLALDAAGVPWQVEGEYLVLLRRVQAFTAARLEAYLSGLRPQDDDVEVGPALRVGRGTAAAAVARAGWAVHDVPAVHAALKAGLLSEVQARIGYDVLHHTEPAIATAVLTRCLPHAERPAGSWRAFLTETLLQLDPGGARSRHRAALDDRAVWNRPEVDGMSVFGARVPAETGAVALEACETRAALDHLGPGDPRTAEQRTADAFGAIMTDALHAYTHPHTHTDTGSSSGEAGAAAEPTTRRGPTRQGLTPAVSITIAWSTLFGGDDLPAHLDRYGPIGAEQARRIAAETGARWRLLLTDDDGQLIARTRLCYQPDDAQRAFVIARDQHCAYPGCTSTGRGAQIDHITPWPAGPTTATNLQLLCKYHHDLKTRHRITCHHDPTTGTTHWTHPDGRPIGITRPPTQPGTYPPPDSDNDPPPF